MVVIEFLISLIFHSKSHSCLRLLKHFFSKLLTRAPTHKTATHKVTPGRVQTQVHSDSTHTGSNESFIITWLVLALAFPRRVSLGEEGAAL